MKFTDCSFFSISCLSTTGRPAAPACLQQVDLLQAEARSLFFNPSQPFPSPIKPFPGPIKPFPGPIKPFPSLSQFFLTLVELFCHA